MVANRKVTVMKKKIAFVLSMCLFMVMMLGACGTDPKTVDYNGRSYEDLQNEAQYYVSGLSELTAEEIQGFIMKAQSQMDSYDESFVEMLEAWQNASEISGDFVELGDFSVEKSGNTLTTTQKVICKDRDIDFQIVYSYYNMEITGYTVEPVYTIGEKMSKAGLNTLISMLTVFAILILISLIISCFKIIPYLEEKKKQKAAAGTSNVSEQVVSQIELREQKLTDDTELVAVIAAAIAASTGQSTSDFVVRSINRR